MMDGQETLWKAGLKHLPEERFAVIEVLDLLHVTSQGAHAMVSPRGLYLSEVWRATHPPRDSSPVFPLSRLLPTPLPIRSLEKIS
jgi:hypothetical protein